MSGTNLKKWVGFIAGMLLTSASLSTGFIWACGEPCLSTSIVWTEGRHELLVFLAAFTAWWGYLLAHYAWTGTFIDESTHEHDLDHSSGPVENALLRRAGVAGGVGILIAGMVLGVVFIRQGNHLMTNIGGILFLGGFVIAHYVETGNPV